MRNRSRRLAVLPACIAAIVPGVLLLAAGKDHPLNPNAAGLIIGLLIGVSLVTLVAMKRGCRRA